MSDTPLTKYLKLLRKEHGYTQDDIARKIGTSRANYGHYETGRLTPSNDVLYKISVIYDIPLTKLVKLSGVYNEPVGFSIESLFKEDAATPDLDKLYSDFLQKCVNMSKEELIKWFTTNDQELVFYYHMLSERDKRLVMYFLKLLILNKDSSNKKKK